MGQRSSVIPTRFDVTKVQGKSAFQSGWNLVAASQFRHDWDDVLDWDNI